MTRSWFGGDSASFVVQLYPFGSKKLLAVEQGPIEIWSDVAGAGGARLTDLLDKAGIATAAPSVTATGQIEAFQGPDGVNDRVLATADHGVTGVWLLNTDGVPAADARVAAEAARDQAQASAQQAKQVAGQWAPSTAYAANQVVLAPDGSLLSRISAGTSRASFDATEQAAWQTVSSKSGTMEQVALNTAIASGADALAGSPLIAADSLIVNHAATPLTTPTYDGSGQATHPSVLYFTQPWNGYRWWMAMTPYPGGNDTVENPSILASTDGVTWVVPAGLTNPIDAPASGFYPDTELSYDNGVMYCQYSNDRYKTSTDGVTWSAQQQMSGVYKDSGVSPTSQKVGNEWWHWIVETGPSPNTLVLQKAPAYAGPYGAAITCTLNNIPAGRELWHLSIRQYHGVFVGAFTTCNLDTNGSSAAVHFATSLDGVTWNLSVAPILAPDVTSWASGLVYRSCLVPMDGKDGAIFKLFYGGANDQATPTWHIGVTDVLSGRALTDRPSSTKPAKFSAGQITIGDSRNIHPNPTMLVSGGSALVPSGFNNNLVNATGQTWSEADQAFTYLGNRNAGQSNNMDMTLTPASLTQGDSWTFSYEVKFGTAGIAQAQATLTWLDSTGTAIGSSVNGPAVKSVGSYGRAYVTSTVPANAVKFKIVYQLSWLTTGQTQVWLRRTQVEKAPAPTAWTPGSSRINRAAQGQAQNIEEWHTYLGTGVGARVGFAVAPSGRPLLPSLSATPTDAAVVGEMCVVAGVLYVCTAAGTPGAWTKVGTQV